MDPKIYVLHENESWTEPLARALSRLDAPFELMHLDEGVLNLAEAPPPGVFYSRMSASSHTRGHRYAAEYTACVLRWLEAHGRLVLNGSHALALEVSKAAQYAAQVKALGNQSKDKGYKKRLLDSQFGWPLAPGSWSQPALFF